MKSRRQMISTIGTIIIAGALFLFPVAGRANGILDFGVIAPTLGTISYAGGANPLIGAGIDVDNVTGLGTPLNNGVITPLGGPPYGTYFLNFTSGNFVTSTPFSWIFGPGGSISISNGSTTLLSGTIDSVTVLYDLYKYYVSIAGFTDYKDPTLTGFYGMPSGPYEGNFNIAFYGTIQTTPGHAFASTQIFSGDITNSPVPEPATILLLGAGLMGAGVFVRRRKK